MPTVSPCPLNLVKPEVSVSHSGPWVDTLQVEKLLLQLLKLWINKPSPSVPPLLEWDSVPAGLALLTATGRLRWVAPAA